MQLNIENGQPVADIERRFSLGYQHDFDRSHYACDIFPVKYLPGRCWNTAAQRYARQN